MSPFRKASLLLPYGFSPLPIDPTDGLPHVKEWGKHRQTPMTVDTIDWWNRLRPGLGLGVLGGYNGLVPIDVDTDDPEVMLALKTVLPRPVVARRGTKGFIGFWRDPAGQVAKYRRKNFMLPSPISTPLVEIKVNGVACIPPTLHRKSGKPYVWLRCQGRDKPAKSLFDTPVDQLGIITVADLDALGTALQPWCPEPPKLEVAKCDLKTTGPIEDKRMYACALAATARAVAYLSSLGADRNIQLRVKSRALAKYVVGKVLTDAYVRGQLMSACDVNGSMEKHGVKQCNWTITSGFQAGQHDSLPVLQDRPKPMRKPIEVLRPTEKRP